MAPYALVSGAGLITGRMSARLTSFGISCVALALTFMSGRQATRQLCFISTCEHTPLD